ncbi:PaaI family thioesterase [Chromobacterium sp. Beijing]|uniref:PaaI family thioesterase n=1 Tax=Chromobacterium sp. Beijing TaxID=2735795 RepID=UPI001F1D071B|nr:PaaI family thioesterase [Chromobacterium sp. Beijing]UJB32065.1 PaaI family thioesterase [Chromobacterium sp. Beijing]
MSRLSVPEFQNLIDQELPLVRLFGIQTESIADGGAVLRMRFNPDLIRPGGTIAGPALMALADATLYAVVLGMIGRVELAVTTSLNINFLRKPPPADVIAEGRILKLGKRLAVGEVLLLSAELEEAVAHVTGTYSIPPVPGR